MARRLSTMMELLLDECLTTSTSGRTHGYTSGDAFTDRALSRVREEPIRSLTHFFKSVHDAPAIIDVQDDQEWLVDLPKSRHGSYSSPRVEPRWIGR